MTTYQLRYQSAFGVDLALLPFSSLQVAFKDNELGSAVVTLDATLLPSDYFVLPGGEVQRDRRLLIERTPRGGSQQLLGDKVWLLRRAETVLNDDGSEVIQLTFVDAIDLLRRRIVAYDAGSSEAQKSSLAADTMIHEIARENLGASAGTGRVLDSTYFSVQADRVSSPAPVLSKAFSRRNVLSVCQEIAAAATQAGTYVGFDVTWTGTILQLVTFIERRGVDRRRGTSNALPVGPEYGNIGRARRTADHRDEVTFVYAAGQGDEDDRQVQTATNSAAALSSPFGRIEVLREARQVPYEDTAALADEADARLRETRPRLVFAGELIDTPGARYDRDYRYGDVLTVEWQTEAFDVRVEGISLQVQAADERIQAQLRQL